MTDPNVTKLLCLLVDHAFYGVTHPETRYIASKALDAIHAAAAEKPAAQTDGPVGIGMGDADAGLAAVRGEVAAAPPVAAVNFEGGRAGGSEWLAATHSEEPFRFVTVRLDIRPGEDAGETVAKMLAACGRGP